MAEPAKASDQAVKVQMPDGQMGTVAAKDVAAVLDQPGSRLVSDKEYAEKQRDVTLAAKYSGAKGFAESHLANVAGGLRGLSAGLSDPLAIKGAEFISPGAGETVRTKLNEYKEAFPVQSATGEAAGVIIPALASGGGRAPVGVSGLLARGGAAVEAGTMRALGGAGAGLAERALVKGAALGAQGAFEGAAYGVGHQISEASLGNHELTADKLLAGAKGGALYGFAGGAALGAGGELLSGALKAAPRTFAVTAAHDGGTAAQMLERKAGEFTLNSAGFGEKQIGKLNQFSRGGAEGVGRILMDEAPALVGKQRVGQMNAELWQEAAIKGKQVHGAAMGNVIESASKTGQPIRVHEIVEDIRRTAEPYRTGAEHIGKQGVVRQIDGFAEDVGKRFGLYDASGRFANPDAVVSLKDLHGIRRSADDLWAGNKINPVATPIKDVRDAVNIRLAGEIEKSGGAEALQAWQDANARFSAFKALEKAATQAGNKSSAGPVLSFADKLFANAGAVAGTVIGGPVGTLVGGALGGAASKLVRSRFDGVAADTILKAARLGAAKELAGGVDAQLGSAVRGFLTQGSTKEGALAAGTALGARAELPQAARVGKVSREDYEKTAQQVASMQTQRKAGVVPSSGLDNFARAAPNTAAAMMATHSRAVQYLASLMPPARVDHSSMFVPGSMYMPKALSPQELKWLRSVEAVKDPMGVFRDLHKGRITGEQVDALKNVYPSLYAHLREQVTAQVKKRGKQLSVEQASSLGILLGEPVHYTQRPEFVAAMQQSKAGAAPLTEDGQPTRRPEIDAGAENASTTQEQIER